MSASSKFLQVKNGFSLSTSFYPGATQDGHVWCCPQPSPPEQGDTNQTWFFSFSKTSLKSITQDSLFLPPVSVYRLTEVLADAPARATVSSLLRSWQAAEQKEGGHVAALGTIQDRSENRVPREWTWRSLKGPERVPETVGLSHSSKFVFCSGNSRSVGSCQDTLRAKAWQKEFPSSHYYVMELHGGSTFLSLNDPSCDMGTRALLSLQWPRPPKECLEV